MIVFYCHFMSFKPLSSAFGWLCAVIVAIVSLFDHLSLSLLSLSLSLSLSLDIHDMIYIVFLNCLYYIVLSLHFSIRILAT